MSAKKVFKKMKDEKNTQKSPRSKMEKNQNGKKFSDKMSFWASIVKYVKCSGWSSVLGSGGWSVVQFLLTIGLYRRGWCCYGFLEVLVDL